MLSQLFVKVRKSAAQSLLSLQTGNSSIWARGIVLQRKVRRSGGSLAKLGSYSVSIDISCLSENCCCISMR